jgi:hypothetical protein
MASCQEDSAVEDFAGCCAGKEVGSTTSIAAKDKRRDFEGIAVF